MNFRLVFCGKIEYNIKYINKRFPILIERKVFFL